MIGEESIFKNNPEYPRAYGIKINDDKKREKSSSGGVFPAISDYVLSRGGVVFGCVLDDELNAIHTIALSDEELYKMQGSKYIQSKKGDVFKRVLESLSSGKKVLFTGTPCECAGLSRYISVVSGEKYRDNLIICDFICHGVPTQKVFREYINEIECKLGKKITEYRFRCKDHGWNQSGLQMGPLIVAEDGTEKRIYPGFNDAFLCGFLSDLFLRPACYNCRFKGLSNYLSDITMGDFWKLNKVERSMNDGKGVSFVLTHNERGQKVFDDIQEKVTIKSFDLKSVINLNKPLLYSAELPSAREVFFRDLDERGYGYVSQKYMTTKTWIIKKIKDVGRAKVESLIQVVMGTVLGIAGIHLSETKWNAIYQFFWFCVVGVSNTLVSYLINITTLFCLKPFDFQFDYVIANTLAFFLAVLWSFHWNSRFVFKVREEKLQMLLKAYLTYAFSGIVLNNILGTLWIHVLFISKYIAPLLNIPFTMPVNFLISKYWTYKNNKGK